MVDRRVKAAVAVPEKHTEVAGGVIRRHEVPLAVAIKFTYGNPISGRTDRDIADSVEGPSPLAHEYGHAALAVDAVLIGNGQVRPKIAIEVSHCHCKRHGANVILDRRLEGTVAVAEQ